MDTSIDTLAIEIESTGKEASGGIDSLIAKLENLKIKVNENLKAIGRLNRALIHLKANSSGISNLGDVGSVGSVGNVSSPTITPEMGDVDVSNVVQALQEMTGATATASNVVSHLANQYDVMGNSGKKNANKVFDALSVIPNILKNIGNSAINDAGRGLKNLGSLGVKGIGSLSRNILSLGINFKFGKQSIDEMGNSVNNLVKKLRMTTLALLGTRGAFTAIRKAVSEYMAYDTALAQTLQQDWAILGSLIAPILEKIIGLFSTLVAYIATFIKMLTGVDLVARANKKSLGGVGSSAGGTAKKVKELSDELGNLQKFDDLNVVDFPKDSGSSGGGGGGGAGAGGIEPLKLPDIDTSPIDKFWEYIKADRWYALGMDIAHAFNNAIRTIDFDYLTEKAREWGKNFADFFNGLRDGLDGELLGKQIAGALNTAMAFVNTFFETYDFNRLGIKLADIFNSMVNSVSWEDIGKYLGNKAMGIFDTLYSFLGSFDFAKLGAGIATGLTAWVDRVDWGKAIASIGRGFMGIIKAIGGFVSTLDWGKLAQTLSDYVVRGINGISDALTDMDWGKFSADLYNGIQTFIHNVNWGAIAEALFKLLGVVASIVFTLMINSLGRFVGETISAVFHYFEMYIKKQNWGNLGENIIFGVLEGIIAIIKTVGKWINDHILQPFIEGVKDAFGIHSPSTVMMEIGKDIINGLFEGVKGIWDKVKTTFNNFKDKVSDKFTEIKSNIQEKVGNAVSTIKEKFNWTNIKNTFETMKNNIGSKISDIKNNIGNKFSEAWSNAKDAISESKVGKHFTNIKNKLKDTFSAIGTTVGGAIGDKFSTVINKVIGFAEKTINGFIRAINKAIGLINDIPGVKIKKLTELSIPRLATGTNKIEAEGLYHLHQGEAVVPKKYNPAINNRMYSENNEKMLRKMDDLLELLNNMETTNNVYIGNEKVHKSTVRYINREQNIYGTTVV